MAKELAAARKLRVELEALDREYRIELPRLIGEAAAQGDISDNAEYQAAKQRQEYVQARIVHVKQRLAGLSMINVAGIPHDRVGFGSTVHLEDTESGDEKSYTIVLPEEVNAAEGKISVQSPVGRAIVGRSEGDEVEIHTPGGRRSYVINSLQTLHDTE